MRSGWIAAGLVLALAGAHGAGAQELNRPPRGFTALFNGRDLTNWKGLIDIKKRATLSPEALQAEQAKADERMRAHWSVKDGILTFDGKGDSLQTARDYGNFELWVDWRIQPKGDSGIYLRGNPQVQIWDRDAGSAQADGKFIGSGGLFNNQRNPSRPTAAADKPAGEWNTFFIRMVGDVVTVRLNGQTVVDNVPLENYWERGKPLPARGPIELQNHGNLLEFRNIFIRELPAGAARDDVMPPTVNLEVGGATLARLVQAISAAGKVEVVFDDPQGKVAGRVLPYVNIRQRSVGQALDLLCRAADASLRRDASGVYHISRKL